MTNFEFYKDKILEMCEKGVQFGLYKGTPTACGELVCSNCDCNEAINCGDQCRATLVKWLYAEHKEQPTLNKYEHALGEALRTGWIAKDRGHYPVCFYTHEPTKVGSEWLSKQGYSMTFEALNMANPEIKFDFIRWEDEEPWSVEELLKLEVKNDCEK